MKYAKSRPLLLLAGLLVVAGLPLAGKWARRQQGPRCELDGLKIEPLYQVRVVDRAGTSHRLCCVHCARAWLKRQDDAPAVVFVTDEASGEEIDARAACFVQSGVATNPVTGNHVHAFRERTRAEEHVRAFQGWVLTAAEYPFPLSGGPADRH